MLAVSFTYNAYGVVFTCNARIAMVLMSLLFYVSCSRWHCTVIEIRSLVQARDDVVVGACDVLWVFGSVEEDVRARGVCSGRSGKNFWGLGSFVARARNLQSGALQGKTRLALGKMRARSRGKREAGLQLGKTQNWVLLVKRFASLFLDRRT